MERQRLEVGGHCQRGPCRGAEGKAMQGENEIPGYVKRLNF